MQPDLSRDRNIFTELLEATDRKLFGGHPARAFARVHLAKVLAQQGVDLDHARALLLEARAILRMNDALVPAGTKQEIAELLSRVEEKSNDSMD